MPDRSSLLLFISATLVLLITPGPAVLYIIARSIDQGRSAGIVSVLGTNVGILAHVAAAALGISALLVSSPLAFSVVRYLGAAYLLWLGVRKLLEGASNAPHSAPAAAPAPPPQPLPRIFRQGIVVNLLNPKLSLFFLAFLPQFVDPSRGSAAVQSLVLGGMFAGLALCSDSTYALLSGSAAGLLRGSAGFRKAQRWLAGGVYLGLGLIAALSGLGKGG